MLRMVKLFYYIVGVVVTNKIDILRVIANMRLMLIVKRIIYYQVQSLYCTINSAF